MEALGVKRQCNCLSAGCSCPLIPTPASCRQHLCGYESRELTVLAHWFLGFCLYEAVFSRAKYQIPYLKDNCTFNGEIYAHIDMIHSVMLLSEFRILIIIIVLVCF